MKKTKKIIYRWGVFKKGDWKPFMLFFNKEEAQKYAEGHPMLEFREIIG